MCCCCSPGYARALGLTLLIVAVLACALAFLAPYWTEVAGQAWVGLWGSCTQALDIREIGGSLGACTWFLDDDWAWEKARPDWHFACQAFSGLGVVFALVALFAACGAVCCCRSYRVAYFAGVTTLFASLLHAVALGVWGYFLYDTAKVTPFVDGTAGRADWAYYLGVGGTLLGFIAGGLFFCRRDRAEDYEKS